MILSAAEVDRAAAVVARGGVLAIPTDTVYGLACHPDDAAAAERIFRMKRRPPGLELSLLSGSAAEVGRFGVVEGVAARLAVAFWPGGLSLIVPVALPRHPAIPRQGETIMVRVPDHPVLHELLRRTGPVASTSANRHGEPALSSAEEVEAELGMEVDAVLDGGPASGTASTIIDCSVTPPRVLRAGPLGEAELRPYLEG